MTSPPPESHANHLETIPSNVDPATTAGLRKPWEGPRRQLSCGKLNVDRRVACSLAESMPKDEVVDQRPELVTEEGAIFSFGRTATLPTSAQDSSTSMRASRPHKQVTTSELSHR